MNLMVKVKCRMQNSETGITESFLIDIPLPDPSAFVSSPAEPNEIRLTALWSHSPDSIVIIKPKNESMPKAPSSPKCGRTPSV